MLVVGLTGNYGMGKSSVLEMFKELGAFTLDADRIVAGLLEDREVLLKLRGVLGDGAFEEDGGLSRERASEMIFTDPGLRRGVEDILHPLVFQRVEEALQKEGAEVAVVEAPVIFERGLEKRFQRTVTVHTDEETALERLQGAGIRKEDAVRRLSCQMPVSEKVKRSDFSIDNGGTPEETMRQVREVFEALKAEASQG